jgi:hypothetical protein
MTYCCFQSQWQTTRWFQNMRHGTGGKYAASMPGPRQGRFWKYGAKQGVYLMERAGLPRITQEVFLKQIGLKDLVDSMYVHTC